jgi:hypothetical protein
MLEIKLDGCGVKTKTFDSGCSGDLSIQGEVAIDSVTDDRETSCGRLDPQLVCATGDGL